MNYTQTCPRPRCGRVFTGEDRETVANEMVEHASVEHGHSLTLEHALTHLDRDNPDFADH